MHEMSVARAVLSQIEQIAEEAGGVAREATLQVGVLSGVDAGLLAAAFERLVESGQSAPLRLAVREVPLLAVCEHCGLRFEIESYTFRCTACGSSQLQIEQGESIVIETLTLDPTCSAASREVLS